MVYIYVLKLRGGKYYVGKSNTPFKRIQSHFEGGGTAWTRKYPPLDIEAVIPECDDYDEDKYTQIYMDEHGVDNVRGGSYTDMRIDSREATRRLDGANDRCFRCGRHGHFANTCYASRR